jgi:hypothetical protein
MNSAVVAAIIAASVSILTLIGTLAAQYFSRRATSRELDRMLAEQRTRTLNERFATAADKLGSDKSAVRLAGVYAMAGLADDWPENRQTCVDVLCAYLRLPYTPDPGDDASAQERLDFRASREVRHTAIRVITAHLKDGAAMSWQGLNFDFTGVVFDGGDFTRAKFSGGTVPLTAGLLPQRSPPRLLTGAACVVWAPRLHGEPGGPNLHHWHSTVRAGDLLHRLTPLSGHTAERRLHARLQPAG